jgi:hypothetical protein
MARARDAVTVSGHVPKWVAEELERRAKALGWSRSQYIRTVLTDWVNREGGIQPFEQGRGTATRGEGEPMAAEATSAFITRARDQGARTLRLDPDADAARNLELIRGKWPALASEMTQLARYGAEPKAPETRAYFARDWFGGEAELTALLEAYAACFRHQRGPHARR